MRLLFFFSNPIPFPLTCGLVGYLQTLKCKYSHRSTQHSSYLSADDFTAEKQEILLGISTIYNIEVNTISRPGIHPIFLASDL